MAIDKDLVFVSFSANEENAAKRTCEAIKTQLKPFARGDHGFQLWDRSMIGAGSNKVVEIEAALRRCKVAVVLVGPAYLADDDIWDIEAKALVDAAQNGHIRLLWQQIAPCNCNQEEINEFRQMIPGAILTRCRRPVREQYEQRISEEIFKAWIEFAPLAQRLGALPIDQPDSIANKPAPARMACDAVALVLTPSGEEKEYERFYQWRAFIQRVGENHLQEVPNGDIGAEPSIAKEKLPELLHSLQSWIKIDSKLEDVPVLELFVPDDLLDQDWGSISTQAGENKPLHTYQPFLLRSSDRLLNLDWNIRRGALKRMHEHLVEGTGAWLPQDQLIKAQILETLDGQTPDKDAGDAVIAAICLLQSTTLKNRASWLRSVLMSMAPLVVWPSHRSSLGEEQVQLCLRHLPLIREDINQGRTVKRPHCPDLTRLAKARQKWSHPEVDLRGLTILVDHPDRAPDRTMLQALFSPSRPDLSSAPPGERPGPQPALLISS